MRHRALMLAAGLLTLLLAAAIQAPAGSATIVGATLTVSAPSSYDGASTLKVSHYESKDGLPSYTFSVTNTATGGVVPLKWGWPRSTNSYDEYYQTYEAWTAAPLEVGQTYEAYLKITTVAHWGCSIYYSDGCRWISGTTEEQRWRFTASTSGLTALAYELPATPAATAATVQVPTNSAASKKCVAAKKILKRAKKSNASASKVRSAAKKVRRVC